ncbi:MAG: hypothetical protein ACREIU_10725, partial [Planctomycetota bacterium]
PLLQVVSIAAGGFPLDVSTWTVPGRVVIPIVSPSNLPSSLPGIVDLALGDNFTNYVSFLPLVADAAQGKALLSFVVPPGLAGLTFYFQSVTIPASLTPPFPATNLGQTFVLF